MWRSATKHRPPLHNITHAKSISESHRTIDKKKKLFLRKNLCALNSSEVMRKKMFLFLVLNTSEEKLKKMFSLLVLNTSEVMPKNNYTFFLPVSRSNECLKIISSFCKPSHRKIGRPKYCKTIWRELLSVITLRNKV